MKVSDIIKKQKIVELQEKVGRLYGTKIYKVIPKLYKFEFPKEKVRVIYLLIDTINEDNFFSSNGWFYNGELTIPYGGDTPPEPIKVAEDGTFEVDYMKKKGIILYTEDTIMDDPKFLKKLLRNYYKFM